LRAGAVAGKGQLSIAVILGAATVGTVAGDGILYLGGRWRGGSVLRGVCSFSLAPDTCVRKTELSFQLLGWRALVIAKFIPGLAFLAAPVAGVLRMPWQPFLLYATLGALLYNVVVIGMGLVLHHQLDQVVGWFHQLGSAAIPLIIGLILLYWAWRIYEKQRVVWLLRRRRITPDELRLRLNSPEPPRVLDLRTAIAFEVSCKTLPGAIRIDPEELDGRHKELPRDCDIVLYCTCPNETTSARVAVELKKYGVERVFPLLGGFEAWVANGYPVDIAGKAGRE
jgi:membrane protein DedA with SNARE-associated domain/rhodanese-related sulfurtransferase